MTALTGTFTLPLDLSAPPARVWPLFAELPLRRSWVRMPGPSSTATHELDFRPGGRERLTNTFVSGDSREELENRTTFYDIVPEERIVFGYEAIVGGILRWVALVTVELTPSADGAGTRLDWTEQYSFTHLTTPTGADDVKHLIGGTRLRLNGLVAAVAAQGASAAAPA
ncbi:MAG TPA: SRPBCC domain-containing protein [Pseudolysinimonas sp.]